MGSFIVGVVVGVVVGWVVPAPAKAKALIDKVKSKF